MGKDYRSYEGGLLTVLTIAHAVGVAEGPTCRVLV